MLEPRLYQTEVVTACLDAAVAGQQRVLVVLPTGTGKTIVFARLLSRRGGRSLVLAHRDELIEQAKEKLRLVDGALDIGIVKGRQDETEAPTVLASVQTLSRSHRLARLTPDFATLVIDEAHHSPAESYRRILEHCGAWSGAEPLVVGVTATPERGDRQSLGVVFEAIVYQKSILEMLKAGYLCDLRAIQVLVQANFDTLDTTHGDFQDGELGRLLLAANAPAQVLEAFQTYAPGRKALCFCPTVTTAYAMAETFQGAGIAAEALDGHTPMDERRGILHRLRTGQTQMVANVGVLTEGYDEPSIDCIIMGRPTQSRPLYQQMLGRGTRTYPGKSDCLILDVVGVSTAHRLQTVASLFALQPAALTTASVSEALDAQDREAAAVATPHDGPLVATEVDLFARRPLAWVQTRQGRWILSMSDQGMLRLDEEGPETWRVGASAGRSRAAGRAAGAPAGLCARRRRGLGTGARGRAAAQPQRPLAP